MVADLFHYGHVNLLKNAKQQGDILYVGIHENEVVESYKRIPILTMDERIKVVESCKYVDKVIPRAPLYINEEFMIKHNIDIVCHAHFKEEDPKYLPWYEVPNKLGKFKRLDYTNGVSTSEIINRIKIRDDLERKDK